MPGAHGDPGRRSHGRGRSRGREHGAHTQDPKNPGKTYTTTWFDMWRFVDGKADEHWDGATLADAAP